MKKRFPIEYYLINDILIEWNPLGLEGEALADEYITHIPLLIKIRKDKVELLKALENIVVKYYRLDYNSNIISQEKDLLDLVDKISSIN